MVEKYEQGKKDKKSRRNRRDKVRKRWWTRKANKEEMEANM